MSAASVTGSYFEGNCQWYSFQHTNISNVTSNGYCTTEQPLYSAFRYCLLTSVSTINITQRTQWRALSGILLNAVGQMVHQALRTH